MMKKIFAITFLLNFLLSGIAFGSETLEGFLTKELRTQSYVMESDDSDVGSMTEEGWYFNAISWRLRGIIGLSVPLLASFTIFPSIQFHWKRAMPEGYQAYKPMVDGGY
jgi:hypothetical protein